MTPRVEILYRKSTGSWMAKGYKSDDPSIKPRLICGYGSLRRAKKMAKEWLREAQEPVLFQTMTLEDI